MERQTGKVSTPPFLQKHLYIQWILSSTRQTVITVDSPEQIFCRGPTLLYVNVYRNGIWRNRNFPVAMLLVYIFRYPSSITIINSAMTRGILPNETASFFFILKQNKTANAHFLINNSSTCIPLWSTFKKPNNHI